jgi:hypothetical protein
MAFRPKRLVDPPGPFAPTKELQEFFDHWKDHPEVKRNPALRCDLEMIWNKLVRRKSIGRWSLKAGQAVSR